ncbi:unnamed protein product, partial [Discosporangium mesarthrocarpum]
LQLHFPELTAVRQRERPSMDLGPRAGDIVTSFEDLIFTVASIIVFVGPEHPPSLSEPQGPSGVDEVVVAETGDSGEGEGVETRG